ncbi:MAG: DinB family protein [Pirellulales bacterium]|nr:DinB family protein [Pirellulales bacterium]
MAERVLLEAARNQIVDARRYTLSLLDDIDQSEWFRQPQTGLNHIAWQVGHLAMAMYGLVLFRQRGRVEEDLDLMSSTFRKKFSRGSTPADSADDYPPISEILEVLNRVYDRALEYLDDYPLEQLNDPVDEPYAAYATKLGCVIFCAHHEMLHAGQIGMLRRLLGKPPVR